MQLAVKLSLIDIQVFLSSFLFKKSSICDKCRTNLIMIGLMIGICCTLNYEASQITIILLTLVI